MKYQWKLIITKSRENEKEMRSFTFWSGGVKESMKKQAQEPTFKTQKDRNVSTFFFKKQPTIACPSNLSVFSVTKCQQPRSNSPSNPSLSLKASSPLFTNCSPSQQCFQNQQSKSSWILISLSHSETTQKRFCLLFKKQDETVEIH